MWAHPGRTGGLIAYVSAVAALHLVPVHLQAALYTVLIVGVTTAGAVALGIAARRAAGRIRLAWASGALGLLSWSVVETRTGVGTLMSGHPDARPMWAHLVNLAGLMFAVAAMFALPGPQRTHAARIRTLCDGVTIAAALTGIVWMFVLAPMVAVEGDPTDAILNLAYPVFAIAVLAIAVTLLIGQPDLRLNTLTGISGGIAILSGTLLVELLMDLAGQSWPQPWVYGGFVTAAVLLSIAPLAPMPADSARGERPRPLIASLPYLPVMVMVVAGAVRLTRHHDLGTPVTWSGVVMMSAVFGRQFLALRQTMALSRDLDEQRSRLAYEATHDSLTGLPNRAMLAERLAALGTAGDPALIMIDLDGFKAINDSLGHQAGDRLLVTVAERLAAAGQSGSDVLVSRLGGDEFAVLLDTGGQHRAIQLAGWMLAAAAEPITLQTRTVSVRASAGIATGAHDDLMRHADLALYGAKAAGKGQWRVFDPAMQAEVDARLQREADLAHGALEVRFQPIVELATRRINAAEALIRMRHPEHGILTPDQFLGAARDQGRLPEFDRWVLRQACAQAAVWPTLAVSVNLSAEYLAAGTVVGDVTAALAANRLPGTALVVEVTETALVADLDAAAATLAQLQALGVRVALDDFGTGYSSLSYLRRLPVDILKIDRSFVQDLDTGDARLLTAVVAMAGSLGLTCVAEGVEHESQAVALREMHCERAQGYLFARPMPADELTRLLELVTV
jgi:diguanylate cyclase (GGDEF)-like protein